MSRLGRKLRSGIADLGVAPTGLFVSPDGSDANVGTEALPLLTINHALSLAASGAVINVLSGTYNEPVSLTKSNVVLRGYGPTLPVIDVAGNSSFGISLTNVSGSSVTGFEIRNALGTTNIYGILAESSVSGCTISDNVIHGIKATGAADHAVGIGLGTNDILGAAHDNLIQNNVIYDIGPSGESWGIWLLFSKNNTIDGNTIFCVRKEGIRDWVGYRNTFTNNHAFLCWGGIELENAVGSYIANNVSSHNVWGYNAKHVNDPNTSDSEGGDPWGTREYCKFWHNTSYHNLHADIAIGMEPAPQADFIDIRNNIFDEGGVGNSWGTANLNDFRSNRGTNLIVDYNAYQQPQNGTIYMSGFPTETNVMTSLSALQSDGTLTPAFEPHGQLFVPTYINADGGDFRVTNRAALTSAADLGDDWGSQIGAEPIKLPAFTYKELSATVISGPPPASVSFPITRIVNKNDDSYFLGASGTTNGAFICDFGSSVTWNVAWHAIYSQGDPGCPKSIHLDVSDTNNGTDWVEVFAQVNPDNEGSSYKYLLYPGSATGRYVRFRYDSIFSGTQVNIADFGFGLISVT